MVVRQNVRRTILLKNLKLLHGNVRLHLAIAEICYLRNLSSNAGKNELSIFIDDINIVKTRKEV